MPNQCERYVKTYPQYIGSPIWHDDSVFKLFHYCLYKASHNSYKWHGIMINPGEVPISIRLAAEELNWSPSKMQLKLQMLQKSGYVSVLINSHGTILRVSDWDNIQRNYQIDKFDTDGVGNHLKCTENQHRTVPEISTPDCKCTENQYRTVPKISTVDRDCTENQYASVPEISTYQDSKDNKDTLYYNRPSRQEPEGFSTLWLAYPIDRRTYRDTAADLYREAINNGATPQSMLTALEAEKRSITWMKESGRFIPGIVKWLQKETWREYLSQEVPEEDEEWITR